MVVKPRKEKKPVKKEVKPKIKKVAKPVKHIAKAVKPVGKPVKAATVKAKPVVKPVIEKTTAHHEIKKPVEAHPVVTKIESKIVPHIESVAAVKPHPKPVVHPVKHEVKIEPKVEIKPEIKVAPAAAPVVAVVEFKELELELPITVKDLAVKLQEKPSVIIKNLLDARIMVGINQALDEATTVKICEKYHCKIKKALGEEETALSAHQAKDEAKDLKGRSPIVTFMGHVDHGKTSLLDAIRKTKVAESEHGGITQHIGAYRVVIDHGEITFLDTPGHEAFTAMRSRGAKITDIVVLVVAADDGIMPQTQEAIDHARAAGVSIIVAINKIDKAGADIDLVKKQLAKLDLNPEDWGGKTITVPVSAKTGEGIDNLLEMIILEAQMLELKANPNRFARGIVIEAQMSKGRGPVATLLVQNGTLHLNENIIVGNFYGKIRAMFNDHGQAVTIALPSVPVEVLGISGVPSAGEQFFAIADEKQAKSLAEARSEKEKQQQIKTIKHISLEDLHAQILEGKIKELKVILKADVQGSLEAIKETLNKLNVSEIKLNIIHAGVGNINNSDVILAVASDALILGFNVAMDDLARELVNKEGVDVKTYNIIYELANDVKAAIEGMLEPKLRKVFLGRAEIRKVLKLSRAGTIAGCFVTKGKFNRTCMIDVVRNGSVIFEGKLSSLKRFKDDVREVAEGFECGMNVSGFDQYMEGDIIEAYDIEKTARKL
ncbi:MAG: translation initiation factor IF-2 [Candidatus Omnitrophota bacterium]|jgi:translation initiation factor IF-2